MIKSLKRIRFGKNNLRKILFIFVFILISFLGLWVYRFNTTFVNPKLKMRSWDVVSDGHHNAFSDMVYWNDNFYLVYRSAETHIDLDSKLVLIKSDDAETWEEVEEFRFKDADIRDAKFLVLNNTLFIYALKNVDPLAEPHTSLYTFSYDGEKWADWEDMYPKDHVCWRPKIINNIVYVATVSEDHKKSILLKSVDGMNWEEVGTIYKGEIHGEPAISLLPDGRMICVARMEGSSIIPLTGDSSACTLIGIATPPYNDWDFEKDYTTKLDGPVLFYNENDRKTYAIGRYEPDFKGPITQTGSQFSCKRTSIFLLEEDELVYLSDLPSGGDTSYPGVVIYEEFLYICYYTSDTFRDPCWLMGEMGSTNIRMAVIKLSDLEKVAEDPPNLPPKGIPPDIIFLIVTLTPCSVIIIQKIRKKQQIRNNQLS